MTETLWTYSDLAKYLRLRSANAARAYVAKTPGFPKKELGEKTHRFDPVAVREWVDAIGKPKRGRPAKAGGAQ